MNRNISAGFLNRKILLGIFLVVFLLTNLIIVASIFQNSLAPTDSSAGANGAKLLIGLASPSTFENAQDNSTFKVAITGQNINSNAAQIVLSYNPSVVQAVEGSIVENSDYLLALNKTIDNSSGRATIDIVKQGDGFIPQNVKLVTFDFTVISNSDSSSTISISKESIVGTTNTNLLSQKDGYGSLQVNFNSNPTREKNNRK